MRDEITVRRGSRNLLLYWDIAGGPLDDRGVTPPVANSWLLGVNGGSYLIPVRSPWGHLAGVSVWTPGGSPKYKTENGFRKSRALYGLFESIDRRARPVAVVVEGFFDVISVSRILPQLHVVGVMGSGISDYQAGLLSVFVDHAVVVPDVGARWGGQAVSALTERGVNALALKFPPREGGLTDPDEIARKRPGWFVRGVAEGLRFLRLGTVKPPLRKVGKNVMEVGVC